MSVQRCQAETSPEDFVDWWVYLNELEPNEFHREDGYFAQIAAWIARSCSGKNWRSIREEDFILKFSVKDKGEGKKKGADARSFFNRLLSLKKREADSKRRR